MDAADAGVGPGTGRAAGGEGEEMAGAGNVGGGSTRGGAGEFRAQGADVSDRIVPALLRQIHARGIEVGARSRAVKADMHQPARTHQTGEPAPARQWIFQMMQHAA